MKKLYKLFLKMKIKKKEEPPKEVSGSILVKYPCSMIGRKVSFYIDGNKAPTGIIISDHLTEDYKGRCFDIESLGKIYKSISEENIVLASKEDFDILTSGNNNYLDLLDNVRGYCNNQCLMDCSKSCNLYKFKKHNDLQVERN